MQRAGGGVRTMTSSLETRSRQLWRYLRFLLTRPDPPVPPEPITRPVVVVGSAPTSTMPAGFDRSFMVVTVNGSQSVAARWGVDVPDVTFLQFNQVEGKGPNAVAVRRVLSGQRTRQLYVMRWRYGMDRLERGLAGFDYRSDALAIVGRYERIALFHKVTGRLNLEGTIEEKFSNGVTGVLYALAGNAPAVIISGIDPRSTGHVYNDLGLKRLHAATDLGILQDLSDRGLPLYTADPHVAQSTGLALWTEEAMEKTACR